MNASNCTPSDDLAGQKSLSLEVASRYGHRVTVADKLGDELDAARLRGDWSEVIRLSEELLRITNDGEGGAATNV